MKKLFSLAAVAALVLGVTACGGTGSNTCDFNVGLVTDIGGIDDKSFNQGTWEGIERFKSENENVCTNYVQSAKDADYVPNLSAMADQKKNLIVAPGFLFETSMLEVAKRYPEQQFLLIDSPVMENDKQVSNVASALFAEHEGSYLVGVASALKAKEAGYKTLGFVGGMDTPLIKKFEAGFVQGAKAVDPSINVLVEYAGTFGDPAVGKTLANKLYDNGAKIVYQAAGGTGSGVIAAAKERAEKGEEVFVVGVDRDQYEDGLYGDQTKSVILTSMLKRVDVAAETVAKKELAGEKLGGQILTFDLQNDGVGIPEKNPNLSDDIVKQVNEYKEKIKSGEIKVSEK